MIASQFCCLFAAEKFLEEENGQNYPILLLNLVDKEDLDSTIRIAGSIAFKNFVKRNWNAHAVSASEATIDFEHRNNQIITFLAIDRTTMGQIEFTSPIEWPSSNSLSPSC